MNDIGMELADPKRMGTVLGRLQGAMNLASIVGALFIFIGFRFFKPSFAAAFSIASLFYLMSAFLLLRMRKNNPVPFVQKFRVRREYALFYWLSILFGTRKQVFLTFAPWVMVTVFGQQTQTIAFLLFAGGVIGIFFKPWLGQLIDKAGEKTILVSEGIILILICLGYGFAENITGKRVALMIVSSCYVLDQLMMSVNMARATYLRKIALVPEDVTSTLTMGVSLDHLFSIAVALIGGILWEAVDYHVIFLLGAGIAFLSLLSSFGINLTMGHRDGTK
jgi:predicted MFS family arabinose efflux permease